MFLLFFALISPASYYRPPYPLSPLSTMSSSTGAPAQLAHCFGLGSVLTVHAFPSWFLSNASPLQLVGGKQRLSQRWRTPRKRRSAIRTTPLSNAATIDVCVASMKSLHLTLPQKLHGLGQRCGGKTRRRPKAPSAHVSRKICFVVHPALSAGAR